MASSVRGEVPDEGAEVVGAPDVDEPALARELGAVRAPERRARPGSASQLPPSSSGPRRRPAPGRAARPPTSPVAPRSSHRVSDTGRPRGAP